MPKLVSVSDQFPLPIVRFGPSGELLLANQAAVDLFGYTDADALLATPLGELFPDETDWSFLNGRAGEPARVRVAARHQTGRNLWMVVHATAVAGHDGTTEYHEAALLDTTELNEAHRRLEFLTKINDRLVGYLTHGLKRPITGVLGFADLLRSEPGLDQSPTIREFVDFLSSAAEESGGVMENLLTAIELDDPEVSGVDPISLTTTQVDLVAEVSRVAATFPPEERNRFELDTAPARVLADDGRVRQIVRNLLSNAVGHGGGEIKVETQQRGPNARVIVSDDGKGVAIDLTEQVFAGQTADGQEASLTQSPGLGLSVSRALARRMGGDLSFSREGRLSILTLELPAFEDSV